MSKPMSGARLMTMAVVLFAFGHAAVKWLPHIPFMQLVFLRAAITVLLTGILIHKKGLSFAGRNTKLLVTRGLLGTVSLIAFFYSLQKLPLASAITIQYLSPIFTVLFAHFLFKERATRKQWFYFFVAFLGVIMVKGFDPRVDTLPLLICMGSATFSGMAYNIVRVLKKYDHELIVVFYFPLVTLPIAAPFALSGWVAPSPRDWIFIAMVGVFTQVAQWMMTLAYQRSPVADVAIFNYLGIFFALGIGYAFFDETFSVLSLAGIGVIMAAVWMGSRRDSVPRSPSDESRILAR